MTIPIKIQCECGQRYAFEVEPVDGRVNVAVLCPVCGADGTAAANAAVAQALSSNPATPVAAAALRVTIPARTDQPRLATAPARTVETRRVTRLPGQMDHTQAEHEARAKILWGDPPKEVIRFLMMQGFSRDEASTLVHELFRERAATVRGNGIRNIVVGIGLMCTPIVAYIIFMSIGVIYVKLFAVTIMGGVWGLWLFIKGIFMVITPKSEPGDVADQ